MKKSQIKLVGVCAAALVAVTAVAPVVSHAQDVAEGGISTLGLTVSGPETVFTKNALQNNTVSVSEINGTAVGTGDLQQEITDFLTQNVAAETLPTSTNYPELFDLIFNKTLATPGTVQDNVGLTLHYPDGGTAQAADKMYAGNVELELGQVYVESQGYNVNGIYKAGDKITFKFFGLKPGTTGTAEENRVYFATSTITVVADVVAPTYNVVAQDILGVVGDEYKIQNGVSVTNAKGQPLTYVAFMTDADTVDTSKLPAGTTATVADGVLTINTGNIEQVLKPGTWYFIQDDTMDPANPGTPLPFDDASYDYVANKLAADGSMIPVYNEVTDPTFTQGLRIVIPAGNTTTSPATTLEYHASRTITVKDPTDVIAENVFRAYNPNDGDHLFTTSVSEFNNVVAAGWADEGISWVAQTNGAKGGYEVYRVYNPNTGEHFYTASKSEYINLGNAGWKQEGVGFFSAAKNENNTPVYRAFNPNAKGPGSHMFTTSKSEYDNIVKAGWTGEGIAFYGLAEK